MPEIDENELQNITGGGQSRKMQFRPVVPSGRGCADFVPGEKAADPNADRICENCAYIFSSGDGRYSCSKM